jgi:hypothetical protein
VSKPTIVTPEVQSAGLTAFFDNRSWFFAHFAHTYPLDTAFSEIYLAHAAHKGLAAGQSPANIM